MKAIILTYAHVSQKEQNILKNTKIYKLALNHHAQELLPDARIITDYVLTKMCQKFSGKIISVREKLRCESKRVEYFDTEFKGSTMISAIEYLIFKNYDEILIVGDNKVNHLEFRDKINDDIEKIRNDIKIFQYSDGYFRLPKVGIADFGTY